MKKSTKRLLCVVSLIGLIVLIFYLQSRQHILNLERNDFRQELIAQEIYELDFEYVFVRKQTLTYYMVCEPPSDGQDLIAKIKNFLTRDRLEELQIRSIERVDDLIERDGKSRPLEGVMLLFIKPYKELEIGVLPKPGTILDYYPEGHTLAIANLDMTQDGDLSIELVGCYTSDDSDKETVHANRPLAFP